MCVFCFSQEELDLIDREEEKKFLTSADYLATNGMPSLISDMKRAVKEVLKGYIYVTLHYIIKVLVRMKYNDACLIAESS